MKSTLCFPETSLDSNAVTFDNGEIYREWFLWQDSEVSQEWEAYDPITNYRVVAPSREMLISKIDQIEDERQV
jgi:hypothetical protein